MKWTEVSLDALARAIFENFQPALFGCTLLVLVMTMVYQGMKKKPNPLVPFSIGGALFALFDSGLVEIASGPQRFKFGSFDRFLAQDHGELLVYRWIFWGLVMALATLWFCRTIEEDSRPR